MPKTFITKRLTLTDNQWYIWRALVAERGWSAFQAALDEAEILAVTSTHPASVAKR